MKNDKKFEPVLPALSEAEQEKVEKAKKDLEVCIEGLRGVAADLVELVSNENVDKLEALWFFNEWVYKRKLVYFDGTVEKMDSIIEELNSDFFDIISMIENREDYLRTEGVPFKGADVKCCFVRKDKLKYLRECTTCGSLLSFGILECPVCGDLCGEDSDEDTVVPLCAIKAEDEDEFDCWGSFPLNPPDPLKWDARADIREHVCSNLFGPLIEQKERGYAEAAETAVSLSYSISEMASAVGILSGFGLDNVQESIYKKWVYDKFFGNGASTLSTLTNKLLEGLIKVKPYLECDERMVQALISPETEIFPKGELEEEMSSFLYGEDDEDDRVSGREYVTYIPLRVAQEKARLCPECGLWVDKTLANCECSHFFEDYIDPAFGDVQELNVADKRVTEIALNEALGIDDDLCMVTEFNGEEIRFINGGLVCSARGAAQLEYLLLSLKPCGNLNGFYIYLDEIKQVYPHNADGVVKAFELFVGALEKVASKDFALSFIKEVKDLVPELKDISFEIEN